MYNTKRKINGADENVIKRIKYVEDKDSYYTRSKAYNINQLPTEIILKIFSYLEPSELYWNARLVCSNWYKLTRYPSLWTTIKVGSEREIDTEILLIWLTIAGRKLKRLEINNRTDAATILKKVRNTTSLLKTIVYRLLHNI